MEIGLGIGVIKRPIDYSVALVDVQGTSTQVYGNSYGVYTPDRTISGNYNIIGGTVKITDPNRADGAQTFDGTVTSIRWYYQELGKSPVAIVGDSDKFSVDNSNNQLIVKFNLPDTLSGSKILSEVHFTNPVTNSDMSVTKERLLVTNVNTVNALSLIAEPGNTTGVLYGGDNFRINPITRPLNKAGDNWQVHVRCQLYDGRVAIKDSYSGSNRNGNAFYFWYLKDRNGNLSRITRNTNWFKGTIHPDGTWDKEAVVDLAKMYECTVVCRAGYIPYGELNNYKDTAGIIQPSKCLFGFLTHEFRMGVETVRIQGYKIASPVNRRIQTKAFTVSDLSTVSVVRRLVLTSGNTVLNLAPNPLNDGRNLVDCLFTVNWYKVDDSGNRTLLQAGSETLSTNLKSLGATSPDNLPKLVCSFEPRVPDLWGNNAVDGYLPEQEDVVTEYIHGNTDFLNDRSFFLIDTTDNKGEKTGAIPLMKNNLLRYAGGGYAPTVGIKQSQYDECMAYDLYTDSAATKKVYSKGNFDAENEWNIDKAALQSGGSARTLYKKASDGTVSAVAWKLRPWETLETKYTIGYGFPYDIYVLDNVVGDSGMVWKGIFTDVTEWDGIDLTAYKIDASHTISLKLAPTAVGPTAYCTVGGKARTFFFAYEGETNCAGEAGNGGFITAFQGGKTYPRTSNVSQIDCMTQSRANNKNTSVPYPFAECGWLPYSSLILSLELQAHTRDISNEDNGFGIGICNDATPTAANFWKIGGLRYTVGSGTTYTYERWDTSKTFTVGGKSVTTNWSQLTNYERSKAQCMEPQMAASYAVELGIKPTTASGQEKTFEFYGGTYYYEDVALDGFTNILTGGMACRLYKIVTTSFTDDTKGKINIEYRLRMSLFDGLSLSGDIFTYCGGGHELVALHTGTKEQGESGYAVTEYFQPDVTKWHSETADHKTGGPKFDFESSYIKLADSTTGGRWTKMHVAFGILPMSVNGSGWRKGDVAFLDTANWFSSTDNDRTRLSLRFGGHASWTRAAPRSANCTFSCRFAARFIGGRAQALIVLQAQ